MIYDSPGRFTERIRLKKSCGFARPQAEGAEGCPNNILNFLFLNEIRHKIGRAYVFSSCSERFVNIVQQMLYNTECIFVHNTLIKNSMIPLIHLTLKKQNKSMQMIISSFLVLDLNELFVLLDTRFYLLHLACKLFHRTQPCGKTRQHSKCKS